MSELWELFPDDINLVDDGREELFHDVSQNSNNSTKSSF